MTIKKEWSIYTHECTANKIWRLPKAIDCVYWNIVERRCDSTCVSACGARIHAQQKLDKQTHTHIHLGRQTQTHIHESSTLSRHVIFFVWNAYCVVTLGNFYLLFEDNIEWNSFYYTRYQKVPLIHFSYTQPIPREYLFHSHAYSHINTSARCLDYFWLEFIFSILLVLNYIPWISVISAVGDVRCTYTYNREW